MTTGRRLRGMTALAFVKGAARRYIASISHCSAEPTEQS
jgi:hypothetical protein